MNPCPCWTARSGTIATAIFTFFYSILLIALLGWGTMVMSECSDAFVDSDYNRCEHINQHCPCHDSMSVETFQRIVNGVLVIQILCLVVLAVLFISSGFTLLGVHSGSKYWLWPYLIAAPISILSMLVFCILWWASHPEKGFVGITVIAFFIQPLAAAGLLVTCVYYKDLKKNELKPQYIVPSDQYHEYRRLIAHPYNEKGSDTPEHLRPGIIVYQDEGRANSRLMYARAQIAGSDAASEDSGYRTAVHADGRPVHTASDSLYSYDKSTPDGRDSIKVTKCPNESIDNHANSQSNDEQPSKRSFSGADGNGGSLRRGNSSGSGQGDHPELEGEPRPGTQRTPQADAVSKFSTQNHFGSRAGDEAGGNDRHSGTSDSDSDASLITHGRAKRKRSDSSRGKMYKKRTDGYASEPESVKASPHAQRYRRMEDSRRKKRGSDPRNSNEKQVDRRFGRSKSSSELGNEGKNQGYGMQITIPQYVVIPPNSGQVRVNSEVNLTIGPGVRREPPSYQVQHGMIQHEEVIV